MPKVRLALHWQIVIALVLGALVGLGINEFWTAKSWAAMGVQDATAFLKHQHVDANASAGVLAEALRFAGRGTQFIGELFVRCLRFIAVPIVLFSLIVAVAGLGDPRKLGRMGGKTLILFLCTGLASSVLGVTLATLIAPGKVVPASVREQLPGDAVAAAARAEQGTQAMSAWQFALDLVPTNPFGAIANAQMLQIVVLAIVLGLGLTLIAKDKAQPVIAACDGLAEAVLKLVQLLMHLAPIAVFALIVSITASLGLSVFAALAAYCVTVVLGLAIILCVLYPTLTTLLTRRENRVGYKRFFRAIAPAQVVAFTSSSSAATLPVTMQCCKERLGASEEVTSFVCSLGVSFNMDGTAFYQAVVVTFLAQLYGVELAFSQLITIALMTAALSIGVPGIPGGSLVIMAVTLDAIGVPSEGIAVILAVDRVLDMCRTVINVSGDAMGTAIIASSEGQLSKDPLQTREDRTSA